MIRPTTTELENSATFRSNSDPDHKFGLNVVQSKKVSSTSSASYNMKLYYRSASKYLHSCQPDVEPIRKLCNHSCGSQQMHYTLDPKSQAVLAQETRSNSLYWTTSEPHGSIQCLG